MRILFILVLLTSVNVFSAESDLRNQVETMIENGDDKQDIEDVLNDNGLSDPEELDLEYQDENL